MKKPQLLILNSWGFFNVRLLFEANRLKRLA